MISSEDVYVGLFTCENLLPKIGDHFQSVNNMAKNNLLPPLLFNKGKYRLEGILKSHPGTVSLS